MSHAPNSTLRPSATDSAGSIGDSRATRSLTQSLPRAPRFPQKCRSIYLRAHVEQIYLYCLGEAAQRYEITIHGFIAMSNHQHILVRDNWPTSQSSLLTSTR